MLGFKVVHKVVKLIYRPYSPSPRMRIKLYEHGGIGFMPSTANAKASL